MKKHYFIALPLPENMNQFLQEKVELLKKQLPFQRWVHRDDLHLTLAFLGDAEPNQLSECWKDCEMALQNEHPFTFHINHFGIFGKKEQPRIFWCAPHPEDQLISIQSAVADACKKNNFNLEERPFRPHITLARKYRSENLFAEEDLQLCQQLLKDCPPFIAEEVTLFETRMDKEPKYIKRERLYLR